MFYCTPCATEQGWPEGFAKSRGLCEVCGKTAICSDRPSSSLPCRVETLLTPPSAPVTVPAMTPDTLSTLIRVFEKLEDLLPDARSFQLDAQGVTFAYGRSVGYRGEYETEFEIISLTWAEFLDWHGDYLSLDTICKERWQVARNARQETKRAAQVEREATAARERAEEKRLAPQRKRERELAELARLKALYEIPVAPEDILHGGQS